MRKFKSENLRKRALSIFLILLMTVIQMPIEVFAKSNGSNNKPLKITVSDELNGEHDVNDLTPLYKTNDGNKFQNIVYNNLFREIDYYTPMSEVADKFSEFNNNNNKKNNLDDYMVKYGSPAQVNFQTKNYGHQIEEIEYQIYRGYHYPDNTWAPWGHWSNGGFHHYINYTNAPQHTLFWEIVSSQSMDQWSKVTNYNDSDKLSINLPKEEGKYQIVFKIKYKNGEKNGKKFGIIGIFENNGEAVTPNPDENEKTKADLIDINRTVNGSDFKVGDTFNVNYTIIPKPITVDYDSTFPEYNGEIYKDFKQHANGKIMKKKYSFTGEGFEAVNNGKLYLKIRGNYYKDITDIINQKMNNMMMKADAEFQENIYQSISNGIGYVKSDNVLSNVEVQSNKITGKIKNITYKFNSDKSKWEAQPIHFSIAFKASKEGRFIFSPNNNKSFVKYTLEDKEDDKEFQSMEINIENKDFSNKPNVTIKVSDALGMKGIFKVESQDSGTERTDKFFKTDNLLKGQGYAEFEAEDVNLNSFKYKFVKSNVQPKNLPTEGWTYIEFDKDEDDNSDVVKDKSGYLKWRSYDVNHMPNLTGTDKWSNRSQTFKTPSNIIKIQPAAVSNNAGSYVDHINGRWLANTVFMKNFFVANNYKEASKFWGYIKPDKDGDYYFGINSDDGSYGYIIVDGKQIDIVNKNKFFVPQGSKFGTLNNVMELKKDKYYPIYLEYFNWGGSAHFQLWHREGEKVTNTKKTPVSTNWFYPAKNDTPGEYPEAIFKANEGVEFPQDSGKYYIAYKTENSDGGYREGFYGPFVVGGEAPITLSRKIVGDSAIRVGDEFTLQYTVKPEDIKIEEKYGESIIKNIQYEETLPKGIEIVEKNGTNGFQVEGQNIKKNLGNITYSRNNEKGVYEADPITFTVRFKGIEVKEFNLGGNEKAIVNYEDLDGANRQKEFLSFVIGVTKKLTPDVVVTRKIAKDKTSVIESRNFEMVYTITPQPITLQDIKTAFGDQPVKDRLVVTNVKFTETFPDANKFDVLKTEGLQNVDLTNSDVVIGNLSDITYIKQSDGSYKAQPFEVKVKLRVSEEGTYTLGSNKASYLEYTVFHGDKIKNPFIDMDLVVNPFKAQLQLQRTILADDDNFKRGETFKSKYIITPLELSLSDYFDDNEIALIKAQCENGNKLLEDFVVKNIQFQENVSAGLSVISDSRVTFTNGKVIGNIPNIIYRLNENKDKLVADLVSFQVQFRCINAGRYILGENEGSFITYTDYDGEQGKQIFNMTSLEFEDINVEEITDLLIKASLVSNSSDHNKYDLNVDVTEAVVNGEKISLKQLKVKNTDGAEYDIYDKSVTAVDGTKNFVKSGLDENFLTGNHITVIGSGDNKTVKIKVPIIKLITSEFVEGKNNIVIESQPDIWVDEFQANGTEYITEVTHPKTDSSGSYTQNNVTLIKGANVLEVEVKNSERNTSRRIFDINTSKTNVVKQGIFVKDDKANNYIIVESESEESNVKFSSIRIIRTIVQHIGVIVEVNNNKSKFEIEVDSRYNTGNTKLNVYELNNGMLSRTPVFTATCKLNEISNQLSNQFKNGKTYIVEYTFITNAQENTEVVNKVKIDNAEAAKLKMKVEKLPELD